MTPTKEEQKWIDDLQKLVNRKPKSIWLFNDGKMTVMRFNEDGELPMTPQGGVDQKYSLRTIGNIHSEGGGW